MPIHMDTGIIKVIKMDDDGLRSARIDCPNSLIPNPGEYILATKMDHPDTILGWPLFPMGLAATFGETDTPFLGPIPASWGPNTRVKLRGPLGHGFNIPKNTRKLAIIVLGGTASRLLPLIRPSLDSGADIVICSSSTLSHLPPAVEIQNLDNIPDVLAWADYLAIDLPISVFPQLREIFNLDPQMGMPCLAQALVWVPMPCAGIGDCAACAVPTRKRGFKLTCKDGPVFDLNEIKW